MKAWASSYELLGYMPGASDVYVSLATHRLARPIENVIIFRFCGGLNFASRGAFKKDVYEAINVDYEKIRRPSRAPTAEDTVQMEPKTLVLDMSCMSNFDVAASRTCQDVQRVVNLLNMQVIFVAPNDRVYRGILHAERLGVGRFTVMPTIHDAISFVRAGGRI